MEPYHTRNEQAYDFVKKLKHRDHPHTYFFGHGHQPNQPVPNIPPSHQSKNRFFTYYRGYPRQSLFEYPCHQETTQTVCDPAPKCQSACQTCANCMTCTGINTVKETALKNSRHHQRCCLKKKKPPVKRRIILIHTGWERLTESLLSQIMGEQFKLILKMACRGLIQGEIEYQGTKDLIHRFRQRGFRVSWGKKI